MFTFSTDQTDDRIGERFPTTLLMTGSHVGTNGQGGIQKQDTLLRPSGQISRLRNGLAEVCLNLLEDIAE